MNRNKALIISKLIRRYRYDVLDIAWYYRSVWEDIQFTKQGTMPFVEEKHHLTCKHNLDDKDWENIEKLSWDYEAETLRKAADIIRNYPTGNEMQNFLRDWGFTDGNHLGSDE